MATADATEIFRLRCKKRLAKAGITRAETYMASVDHNSVDIDEIKIKIAKLEDNYKVFTDIQMEIATRDDANSVEELDDESAQIENKYNKIRIAAEKIIKGREHFIAGCDVFEQTVVEANNSN